jgi:hypothetical protein
MEVDSTELGCVCVYIYICVCVCVCVCMFNVIEHLVTNKGPTRHVIGGPT